MKRIILIFTITLFLISVALPMEGSYYNAYKYRNVGPILEYLTVADFDEASNGVVTLTGDSFYPVDPNQLIHLSGRCWFVSPHSGVDMRIERFQSPAQVTPSSVVGLARSDDLSVVFSLAFRGSYRFKINYQISDITSNEMACTLLFEPVK